MDFFWPEGTFFSCCHSQTFQKWATCLKCGDILSPEHVGTSAVHRTCFTFRDNTLLNNSEVLWRMQEICTPLVYSEFKSPHCLRNVAKGWNPPCSVSVFEDVTGEMQQANREIFSALFFALYRSMRGSGEGDPFVAHCKGTTAVWTMVTTVGESSRDEKLVRVSGGGKIPKQQWRRKPANKETSSAALRGAPKKAPLAGNFVKKKKKKKTHTLKLAES